MQNCRVRFDVELLPEDTTMLLRRLEPEVMDTAEDACDYDRMDHSTVNRVFVDDLLSLCRAKGFDERLRDCDRPLSLLDVGTGTALIPIELCSRNATCRVTAVDLATEMLKLAEQNVSRHELGGRIALHHIDAKQMPYSNASFEAVISNSIVHHIPEPRDVFSEMLRVLRPSGILFVRDLLRPETEAQLETLVATYAGQENEHSQQLFRDSLHAALTLNEVQNLVLPHGIPASAVTQTSDRHWTLAWQRPR